MTQTATTLWLQLAAQATAIANDMRDPENEQLMREIADRYEALATRADPATSASDVLQHHRS
jgi:hypothetical protein